jgi:signal recognition particle receptor subunit beta
MAVFDDDSQKIVVRVLYDGPSGVGKTTNLRRLGEHLTERRRGALRSPREEGGKTTTFDWMDVEGGLVGGHGLRCQILTTPGRATLARRRRRLLAAADVIVFVTDSTPEGLREGRRWMELLRVSHARDARTVPLVVQANKQDRARSVEPGRVAEALGLDPSTSVVAARAEDGVGVRETLVLAMRAAADVAQRILLAQGTTSLAGAAETPDQLLALFDEDDRKARASTATATGTNDGGRRPYDASFDPALPHPDAPTGFIWPGSTGRETLRRVTEAVANGDVEILRDDDESGMLLRAGAWLLRTSGARRFDDPDEGRAALLAVARAKTALGKLLLPGSAVAVTSEADGGARLWTVSPRTSTLRQSLDEAVRARDAQAASLGLALWVDGVIEALVCAARQGLSFDLRPERFAAFGGDVGWIDEDDDGGSSVFSLLAAELERHAGIPGAGERLLAALEGQASARLTGAELGRLAERGILGGGADVTAEARDRIERACPALATTRAVAS